MADTDLEYTALPTTDAIESGDEVLLVRDGVPIRFTGILPTENGVSDAVAEAEAARDAALAYGNATVKATWTEAAALTGLANGAIVLVVNTDTGTHASVTGDVGSAGGQTPNSGVFRYSTSLTALVRIATLESAAAQAWAESATAPGAAGTKSAKSWVNYLLSDTGFAAVAADMLLGAPSKILTVGADLLLGAASKIAIVAADLALGAGSKIAGALASAAAAAASASGAADSATAAAASAASVPTGAGVSITGTGAPGDNVGSAGAFYYDTASGYRYGPKTASGWGPGIPVTQVPLSATRALMDMRIAGSRFPTEHWTFSRGSQSTDLLETDPYTYVYSTFANNVPVMRAGAGFYSYMRAQQFLSNPTAPASHTTASNVAVGTAILLVWGPAGAQVQVSAGSAVGSGFTTVTCNGTSAVKAVLTITTAGTITVTVVSGAPTLWNLQQNPSSPTATEAVPFIPYTGIREPDKAVGTAAVVGLLNASAGYMRMGVSKVTGRSYGRSPCLWGLNNVTAGYCPSDTQYTYYDVANHTGLTTTGSDSFSAGVTVARTWDGTATVDFGAGNRAEMQIAFQYNNGVPVTAATLGHPSTTNTSGANQLNGIIGWYEIDTGGRITPEALYEKYTSIPSPTLDQLLKGYLGPTQFPHVCAQERLLRAGVIDHLPYGVAGPSHEGGVATGTNIRQVAWMTQMVADLESQGYAVTDDAIVSMNSSVYSGGGNAHDSRDTYTGAAPTLGGVTFGGEYISVPAGTVLTFTPPTRQTSRFHLAIYTNAAYGNAEVSVDGGTTPIACNENGATSIPSTPSTFTASITDDLMTVTGAVTGPALAAGDIISGGTAISGTRIISQVSGTAGGAGVYRVHIGKQTVASAPMTVIIRQRTFDAALGMKAWSTKATGNLIKIAYRYARNPLIKQRVFFNGGRNGFNVTNLAQDTTPESSYLMLIRALGFCAVIGGVEQTNDMAGSGTDFLTVYDPKSAAIINAIRVTADPVGLTDPPTWTNVYALAVQDKVVNQARAVFWKYGVPFYDLYGWKTVEGVTSGYSILSATAMYLTDGVHLQKLGQKRWKGNQMGTLLKRLWAAA